MYLLGNSKKNYNFRRIDGILLKRRDRAYLLYKNVERK